MKPLVWFGSLLVLLLPAFGSAQGTKREILVDQVKKSIDRGVTFLKQAQRDGGSWEVNLPSATVQGGWTSLALLALLNAGVPVDDPVVARGLTFLRGVESRQTYVVALQTMVLVEAGQVVDRERITRNVQWLIDARVLQGEQLRGWTYGKSPGNTVDGSNTQYAILGLWAGKQAGVDIQQAIWQGIRDMYVNGQEADGGWPYMPTGNRGSSLTMTVAGVCGLLLAAMELQAGVECHLNNPARRCGVYPEDEAIGRGQDWVSGPRRDRLQFNIPLAAFYNIYGFERLGRLSGQRFLGMHDWYREGCKYLVSQQQDDGSWSSRGSFDQWPVVSTSFALLFLSKGRTPVLMSKLVHGDWPRSYDDTDWNNDRNDLRHLTEYCSRELFKKVPLAWQSFDLMRAAQPRPGSATLTEDDLMEATSELLQSPIAYINGHRSPLLRFRAVEKDLLKRFVENGGFILAEACCGSPEFDQGFKALVQDLWPDATLNYLPPEHPVWATAYRVKPGDPYKLMGLEMGCKTVLIYSPQDLSCKWEANKFDGVGQQAFRLGANIVAYATGMELPRPRLTHVEVASSQDDLRVIPRGFLKVAQLKHRGDWQPAPRAMRNLMDHLRQFAGLDVALKTEELFVTSKSLIDFKFVYLHGRADFSFAKPELERLRFNLETGGLLFADACCGKDAFDAAFRRFIQELFPEQKLERVPLDDELFSKDLNGEALTQGNIRCRSEKNGAVRNQAPYLEGIKLNGRWVVLYSKYDIGCALERHQAPDCLGYTPDSAFKLAGAAVLYTLRP